MVIGYIEYKRIEDENKMNINDLLKYFQGEEKAKLYNKIANILWDDFGISSSELNLITSYVVNKALKEENKNG